MTTVKLDQSTRLTECPACGASLEMLPDQCTCEKCGLEIDKRWWVFGGRKRRGRQIASILAGFLFLAFAATAFSTHLFSERLSLSFWMQGNRSAFAIGIFGILAIGNALRFRMIGDWVAVGPTGLRRYRGARMLSNVTWGEFIVARAGENGIELVDARGGAVRHSLDGALQSRADRRAMVDAANSYPHKPGRRSANGGS